LEIWLDDLKTGKLLATISIPATGERKTVRASLKGVTGRHDVFVKFPEGKANTIHVSSLRFLKK
jgi:hypothetical protein